MILTFNTSRLKVIELSEALGPVNRENLLTLIPNILTPEVVKHLPPYFHGVNSKASAKGWLERMTSESRLFLVEERDSSTTIGFLFVFIESAGDAHIGYLLEESYWGQGFASELLQGFIIEVAQTQNWNRLIGGVDRSNRVSANLLLKLGFSEIASPDSEVVNYEYLLP